MNREHRVEINFGCEVTEVSRSGFYDRKDRPPSERALENAQLVEQIRAAHAKGRGVYGSPRVAQAYIIKSPHIFNVRFPVKLNSPTQEVFCGFGSFEEKDQYVSR
jgi:hypothetical protein